MLRGVPLIAAAALVVGVGCASERPDEPVAEADEWVGSVTTDGDVTTVINEAGSLWGADAELVEEVSIGVEIGADEYMFGSVRGVWATDDRIYVLDSQVPAVRVYDHDGAHIMDIGGAGQGPGEFTDPAGLVVNDEGEILVVESNMQIDVFDEDGRPKATWNSGSSWSIGMPEMIVLGVAGQVWVPGVQRDPIRFGRAEIGSDGSAGEPFFPPEPDWESTCLTFQRRGRETTYCNVPFWPHPLNALLRDGGWVVGINDRYAFDLERADGTTLRVERYWDPVPVLAEEAEYHKRQTVDLINERMSADPEYVWNGPEIPDHKPAYVQLMPDRDGRIWVLRGQQSVLSTACFEDVPECWSPAGYWLDVFAPDGRYLGAATLESRYAGRPFIDDRTIVAIEMDEAGTVVVAKYRLDIPGVGTE